MYELNLVLKITDNVSYRSTSMPVSITIPKNTEPKNIKSLVCNLCDMIKKIDYSLPTED